jgi:hypothetical protein
MDNSNRDLRRTALATSDLLVGDERPLTVPGTQVTSVSIARECSSRLWRHAALVGLRGG